MVFSFGSHSFTSYNFSVISVTLYSVGTMSIVKMVVFRGHFQGDYLQLHLSDYTHKDKSIGILGVKKLNNFENDENWELFYDKHCWKSCYMSSVLNSKSCSSSWAKRLTAFKKGDAVTASLLPLFQFSWKVPFSWIGPSYFSSGFKSWSTSVSKSASGLDNKHFFLWDTFWKGSATCIVAQSYSSSWRNSCQSTVIKICFAT